MESDILEFMGAPGSPYSRKMLALLRYRHIPYQISWHSRADNQDPIRKLARPKPKVALLPTFYLKDDEGAISAQTDSTPLLRRFEVMFEGRSVIPKDPICAFLNYIIEDYADEWLTKAMFHYRWSYQDDIDKAAAILPLWGNISAHAEEVKPQSDFIRNRQISRLSYVGSNETTKEVIETSFKRFLKLMDNHLTQNPFLFGKRPSSADFAIYGQMTCLALFDPTPQKIILSQAPRLYAWTEIMEDLSGYPSDDNDWQDFSALPDSFKALCREIAYVYAPYLAANQSAVQEKKPQMEAQIDGKAWVQNPFPYHAKCLQWIKAQWQDLSHKDRLDAQAFLKETQLDQFI